MENLDDAKKDVSADATKSAESSDTEITDIDIDSETPDNSKKKDAEKDVNADATKSAESADAEITDIDIDSETLDNSKKKIESQLKNEYPKCFNFYPIELLYFRKTPIRNKELHRFWDTLHAPFINVPLLVAERQEDILPLLSLYVLKEVEYGRKVSFFSVTPSDFGMHDDSIDTERTMNLGGSIIEFEKMDKEEIPVYCDLSDYIEHGMCGEFISNFLTGNMPAVLFVSKQELEGIRQNINQDKQISGGLENPMAPYDPYGFAKTKKIEIAPLTPEEKHVYFSYYIDDMAYVNGLKCSPVVRKYFVDQMLDRFSHQDIFFKVFDLMNQAIVLTEKRHRVFISKDIIDDVLQEYAPLHNRTRALVDLDARLKEKIYGQEQAIDTCYETILADLDDDSKTKPIVLGFFGPSGVGKTALAEEISQALTGKKVSTINMAEYSDSFKVSILTGSSKGYEDSDEDGLLAKIVKENPRAVILLDEFEKAHPEVQQMFLGVFDKGSLHDNHSGQIDMSQTTIIITSNAGIRPSSGIGFGSSSEKEYVADKDLIQNEFPPELLGRLDAKILFNPLSQEVLEKIVDKFMEQLKPRFDRLGVQVFLSPEAKQELIEKAKDPTAGARPILALIRQKIKTPIEIGVLKEKIKRGSCIIIRNIDKKRMDVVSKYHKSKIIPCKQNVK